MQSEASLTIDRPIEEVFDYTTRNVAEWSQIVVEDELLDEKPNGVGTTFRIVTEDRGCQMEFEGVVTRHEPPVAHAVSMKGKHFDMEAEYLFEDLPGGTRVTQRSTVHGKGFARLMLFFAGWLMRRSGCKAVEKELANLKRLLEARESPAGS